MFTGIIQALGTVTQCSNLNEKKLILETELNLDNCKVGSSICCDGICLTATSIIKINNKYQFEVIVSEETANKSTAKFWSNGTLINIEKSLRIGDEISGHFVYGHVDCVTQISTIQKLDSSWEFEFKKNDNMKKYIVEKGSISINGISLTIANKSNDSFSISIIPHTYNNTNLNLAKVNDLVNIEFDALSRYVLKNGSR